MSARYVCQADTQTRAPLDSRAVRLRCFRTVHGACHTLLAEHAGRCGTSGSTVRSSNRRTVGGRYQSWDRGLPSLRVSVR